LGESLLDGAAFAVSIGAGFKLGFESGEDVSDDGVLGYAIADCENAERALASVAFSGEEADNRQRFVRVRGEFVAESIEFGLDVVIEAGEGNAVDTGAPVGLFGTGPRASKRGKGEEVFEDLMRLFHASTQMLKFRSPAFRRKSRGLRDSA
jgi:hypothetical protein